MASSSVFQSLLRLTKHSTIYGIGHVLSKSFVVLLLPIHTNFINKFEYGIATQLFSFLAIVGVFYSYGLNSAFIQFYIQGKNQKEKDKFFSTAFLTTVLTSLVFSVLLFLLKDNISELLFGSVIYSYLLIYSIGILAVDALVILAFNILRADEMSWSFTFLSVANVALNLILNVLFVAYYSWGVKGIFLANLISSSVLLLMLIPVILKHLYIKINFQKLKRMLKFGLPFVPAIISIALINSIDRFYIKSFLGMEAAGTYGAGYKLGLIVRLFINAFQFAWLPFFMATAKEEFAKEIFSKILTYFALICSFIFLAVTMYVDKIVRLNIFGFTIFGEEYWGSTQIVPAVLIAYIAYGFYLNFMVGIYIKEKTKYLILITGIGALINVIGNIVLIPVIELIGAAVTTAISYICMAMMIYFFSQKYYPIKYEFLRIIKIIALSAMIFVSYSCFNLPYSTITKLLLLILYLFILYFSGFFSQVEINRIKGLLKK